MRMEQIVRIQAGRGSYMPVLMKVMSITTGPVYEIGCGYVSTPYLHWSCFDKKRPLVSYENDPAWHEFTDRYSCDYHKVLKISDWGLADVSGICSVALVDHSPDVRRKEEIKRLTHAEYVVVHDTENRVARKYNFEEIFGLFRYRYKYRSAMPHTTVFSNYHDLSRFTV